MSGFRAAGFVGRIHHVEVEVGVVAQRAGVSDAVSLVRPDKLGVARLAVGEHGDIARGNVEAEDLVPLTSADVFAKEEVVALVRLIAGVGNAVAEERKLGAGSAGHGDLVYLHGVGKAGADEDLALLRDASRTSMAVRKSV